uniref:Apolipoprotein N-acyltransferase n=1 Tax=Leptospirillum ferriphilum TaxID=178606 RepID=A0A7C3QW06_9BACT
MAAVTYQTLFSLTGKLLLPLLGGTALGFLFQHHAWATFLWWLAPVCFLPLWNGIRTTLGKAFGSGFIFGFGTNVAGLFWLVHTMVHYGHVPWALAIFGDFLLSAYMALFVAIFWTGTVFLRRTLPSWGIPAVAAMLWVLAEGFRGILFTGFPWNPLGSLLFGHPPFLGVASLAGTTGMSFLMVLVAGFLGEGQVLFLEGNFSRAVTGCLLPMTLIVSLWSFLGGMELRNFPEEGPSIRVALVQGNIPQDRKWTRAFLSHTIDHYLDLSRQALSEKAQVILWPETALPVVLDDPPSGLGKKLREITDFPVPVVTGTLGLVRTGKKERLAFTNEAAGFDGSGRPVLRYRKMHLVPFGEYIPLPWLFGWLRPMTGITGDMVAGKKPVIFSFPVGTGIVRMAPFICYEALYPSLVRKMALRRPDFLVVLSDDAWFGHSDAPYQLFRQSLLRSVENGIPLLRVANTGLSGVMEPNGTLLGKTSLFTRQEVTITVRQNRRATFYRLHGEWVFRLSLLFILFLLAWSSLGRDPENPKERTVS